jgi:hypothetical protein
MRIGKLYIDNLRADLYASVFDFLGSSGATSEIKYC